MYGGVNSIRAAATNRTTLVYDGANEAKQWAIEGCNEQDLTVLCAFSRMKIRIGQSVTKLGLVNYAGPIVPDEIKVVHDFQTLADNDECFASKRSGWWAPRGSSGISILVREAVLQ